MKLKFFLVTLVLTVLLITNPKGTNTVFIIGSVLREVVLMIGIPALIGCIGYFKDGFSKRLFDKSFWIIFYIRIVLIGLFLYYGTGS